MGTEGILRVKLTGDNSGFTSSMKEASKETGNFANSAKEASKHTEHGDHALHSFAMAAKLAGREAGHFAHMLTMVPLPIAAVAIGLAGSAAIANEWGEEAKKAAEMTSQFANALREVRQEADELKETHTGHVLETIAKAAKEARDKKLENAAPGIVELGLGVLSRFDAIGPIGLSARYAASSLKEGRENRMGEADSQLVRLRADANELRGTNGQFGNTGLEDPKTQRLIHQTLTRIEGHLARANAPGSPDANLE